MDPESPIPETREADLNDLFDHARIKCYGITLLFMSRWPIQVPCFEPHWSGLAVIDLNSNGLM